MAWSSAPELGTGRAGDFRSLEVTAQVSAENILNDSAHSTQWFVGRSNSAFPIPESLTPPGGVNWGGEEEFPADPGVTEEASPI